MTILIDTHVLLWALFDPSKLSRKEQEALTDKNNKVFVSLISLWEISLKYALGKLELKQISPEELPKFIVQMGFETITLDSREASTFHQLPKMAHWDPFDRMLIWQAVHRQYVLMSHDRSFTEYKSKGLEIFDQL